MTKQMWTTEFPAMAITTVNTHVCLTPTSTVERFSKSTESLPAIIYQSKLLSSPYLFCY